MVVDIRDTTEWKKDGVPGSVCIPERYLKDNIDFLKGQENVIFVCCTGLNAIRIANKYSSYFLCKGESLKGIINYL